MQPSFCEEVADYGMVGLYRIGNKIFTTAIFATEKEANKFCEKNPDHGVISAHWGEETPRRVHVAQIR